MAILIGGAPSSGSSLLAQILNRHSQIFCGPETSLFTKKELYHNWNKNKLRILKHGFKGLRSPGWHKYNRVDLDPDIFLYNHLELKSILQQSTSFTDFSNSFFSKVLDKENKSSWAEKTPSNSYVFDLWKVQFPEGKCLLTTRHPYECIASLIARGYSVFEASAFYLSNLSCLFSKKFDAHIVRYEHLTSQPIECINSLLKYLELGFENEILEGKLPGTKIMSWRYSEEQSIQTNVTPRYPKLSKAIQKEINYYIQHLYFKNADGNTGNIAMLCEILQYPLSDDESSISISKWPLIKDALARTLRNYPWHIFNYPLFLK